MRRLLTLIIVPATLAMVFALYAIKNDTRLLDERVGELARMIERTRAEVATLRADWGYLTEPARIERLAREHLGYRPMQPDQIVSLEEAGRRLGRGNSHGGTSERRPDGRLSAVIDGSVRP
ncbi:MAG: hypothetical protein GC150_06650 [Rhizobiales bacterium]|nr:hypothetical protein [Hyphomicrobiales bacterium]